MNNFNFCPHCSSQNFKTHQMHKFECFDCGFIYYHNIAAAVAVIIEKNDKLLFTQRNANPKKGMLDLPGGFTDPNETAEETCVRELKEELDLNFRPDCFSYLTSFPNKYEFKKNIYFTEDMIFTAKLPDDACFTLEKEEIQAIQWIPKDEIDLNQIGFQSLQKAVELYLTTQASRNFSYSS